MKMIIGVILLIISFLTFIAGVGIIYNTKAKDLKNNSTESVFEPSEPLSSNKPGLNSNDTIFENLISMATVDGILTPNEIEQLKAKAIELNLNYGDFSDRIDELLQINGKSAEAKLLDKNKEKGNDFEAFIVQKFSKQYFKLLAWAGDKYVEGIYAETTPQPDLTLRFKMKDVEVDFAVECKYRSSFPSKGVEWCTESQLTNYRNFAKEKNIPVFVALGIGGTASLPDELFIVLLARIENVVLSRDFLKIYKKSNFKENNLYFDFEHLNLH